MYYGFEDNRPSRSWWTHDKPNSRYTLQVRSENDDRLGDLVIEEKGDGTFVCRLQEVNDAKL